MRASQRPVRRAFGKKMKTILSIVVAGMALMAMLTHAAEDSSVEKVFVAMRVGKYNETYGQYTFPALGTNDIPALLSHVGSTNILKSFPVNGVSSIGRMTVSEGMIALWLIEGIRIGGTFPSLIPVCYDRDKEVPRGALFYAEAGQDLAAKAYVSWWEKTKGYSKDFNPFSGTFLTWSGERGRGKQGRDKRTNKERRHPSAFLVVN